MLDTPRGPFAAFLLLFVAGGALAGGSARRLLDTYMKKVGITDAASERQQLLQQLVELQDKLRTGEQSMTFLSIDVVGSTRMKENAEQLQVEYTFSEYHRYVETVIKRYGGRVHSTAGDGVTCAFEEPAQAFKAGRNIQAGLIELNTHRNKLDTPIRLRIGMHTGTVIAPTQDIQSLNFAHVIDIAAHLQKVCPVGGLAVSDSSAIFLPGGKSGIGDMRVEALDVGASVWQPRTAVTTLTAAPGPANA
jgi:class 3 adenylate cyclase